MGIDIEKTNIGIGIDILGTERGRLAEVEGQGRVWGRCRGGGGGGVGAGTGKMKEQEATV